MQCNGPESAEARRHRYHCGGLAIESDLALPPLRVDATGTVADIRIRLGKVGPGTAAAACFRRAQIYEQFRYEVASGSDVVIELLPDAEPAEVVDLIISRVFTVLFYQRGLLALHASAVAMPDGLVVICGPSGAGKSTLAAVLAGRGHPLVADDMLVVARSGGRFTGSPAALGLKLSPASLAAIGRNPAGLRFANRVEAKYYLPYDAATPPSAPIVRLVQFRGGPPGVTPLDPVRAAAGSRHCIRMLDLMHQAPDPAALWRCWLDLVGQADNLAVSHDGRMDALDAIATALEGPCADMPARLEAYG